MSPIRLVVTDVDGTLLPKNKLLTARSRDVVAELGRRDIRLVLASSRPPLGLRPLLEELRLQAPLCAFNGGQVLSRDFRVLVEHPLPLDLAREAVSALTRCDLDVWVFRGTSWYVRDPQGDRVQREQEVVQFAPTVIDDLDPVLDGAVKIVGVSRDPERVERGERELRAQYGERACAARSHPAYLDVTHPDAHKGAAVRYLSRLLQVPAAQIATLGDMPSDVTMFAESGLSIAMGNADPEVRARAHHVTTSNEDEGFARAIERWVLGRA